MKYAVIQTGGQQFLVKEGDVIDVNLIPQVKKTLTFPEVLLLIDGDTVQIGQPLLKNISVKAKVLQSDFKGPKLLVMRFKAKSRYRKRKGHRQRYTRLQISSIGPTKK